MGSNQLKALPFPHRLKIFTRNIDFVSGCAQKIYIFPFKILLSLSPCIDLIPKSRKNDEPENNDEF